MVTTSGSTNMSAILAKDKTCLRIEQMEADREERRRAMIERKKARSEEEKRNIAAGNPGDVDFIGMVRTWREEHMNEAQPHTSHQEVRIDNTYYYNHPRICICVRKRPISAKEIAKNDHDSISCINPSVWIHSAKFKVDGISKYLDHSCFRFDHTFDEIVTTEEVYQYTTMPLVDFICSGRGGRATVFAYGQTGSGKTHTMSGIQKIVTEDLFTMLNGILTDDESGCSIENTFVSVSFFELYGGYVQDLLNDRNRLKILEDGKGEIHVNGLTEMTVNDPNAFLNIVAIGNGSRTTHTTEANDSSSRSHAICQIMLRDRNNDKLLRGKLSLVDLAGSERGSDTKSHNQQRRTESADINTSLLTLKECIRALDAGNKRAVKPGTHHVPYRGSKLTLILKDCFTSDNAMTAMIATVSPGATSADHSINTLRYADRIKSQSPGNVGHQATINSKGLSQQVRIRRRLPSPKPQQSLHAIPTPTPSSLGERIESRQEKKSQQKQSTTPVIEEYHGNHLEQKPLRTTQSQQKSRLEQQRLNDNEQLYRKTLDALIEDEELILSTHMSNIQENAELLTVEGDLLTAIEQHQQNNVNEAFASSAVFEEYVSALEEILDRKEEMILKLQKNVMQYEQHLKLRQNFQV